MWRLVTQSVGQKVAGDVEMARRQQVSPKTQRSVGWKGAGEPQNMEMVRRQRVSPETLRLLAGC